MLDFEKILNLPSPLEPLNDPLFKEKALKVFIKRDDLIHPELSGNKWRKLKYNLLDAKVKGYHKLITFGGAHSNHIYAMAAIAKYTDFEVHGIIRGDELKPDSSLTLQFAANAGMKLTFVSREAYKDKENLLALYRLDDEYIIPEGGTSPLALAGVEELYQEIVSQLGYKPDYIFCPVGSGGTIAGLIKAGQQTKIMGICVLKNGHYLEKEIMNLVVDGYCTLPENFEIFWDYHHGGYAKKTSELLRFIHDFKTKHPVELEHVYSGKMFFAFYELIKNHIRAGATIVLIHTGGLR
ncbi:1-aminocyclopropane-1-carboxylate deaminase/D-cysteine desulfhydrase [Emticicia sp. 17c]|uniref:1-aminocyclopropane-1-carboxylate deaminase/D-cysteine desulfhydrase n=1 Tax=Emticicia sp. 17c TaxID=3127704 RepID=UPI00301D70EA